MKGMRKLSKEQKRDIAAIAAKRDEDIDLSDMPEVLDWSKAEIGKFYRPPKKAGDHAVGRGCFGMVEGIWQGLSDEGEFPAAACDGKFTRRKSLAPDCNTAQSFPQGSCLQLMQIPIS
jgi:hypothetical protein